MKRGSDSPARSALQSIARGAGRSRLGDRLPEDKRPSPEFMISIGLGPSSEEDEELGEVMGDEDGE